MSWQPTRQ